MTKKIIPDKENMMNNLLEIKNLNIEAFYEDSWQPIVRDISLNLKRGEVLGLIGESGAGKSTIGLAAMGYARQGCRIASGSINLDGTELFTKIRRPVTHQNLPFDSGNTTTMLRPIRQ